MLAALLTLLLAVADGPPPYADSLRCAGLTRAWATLEVENKTPAAAQARDDAEFWAFAVMDAARRDGVTAKEAEAAHERVAAAARKRFELADPAAARELLDCQVLIPHPKG
jgi:hypothetical protein